MDVQNITAFGTIVKRETGPGILAELLVESADADQKNHGYRTGWEKKQRRPCVLLSKDSRRGASKTIRSTFCEGPLFFREISCHVVLKA